MLTQKKEGMRHIGKNSNTQHLAVPVRERDPYAPSQVNLHNPYPQDDVVVGGDGGLNARHDGTGLDKPPEFYSQEGVNNINTIDVAGGDFTPTDLLESTQSWSTAASVILAFVVLTFLLKPSFEFPYKFQLLALGGIALLWVCNQKSAQHADDATSVYVSSVLLCYLLIFALLVALSGFTLELGDESQKYCLLAGVVCALLFVQYGLGVDLCDPFAAVGQTWTSSTRNIDNDL